MLWLLAFTAGLVRGFSGFGFSMILALGLMATVPPSVAVPVALLLDLVCSAGLWIGAYRGFHQPVGYRLIAGMLLAVPIGTLLLTILPALWMTPAVAAVCLVGSGLILARPVAAQKTVDQSRHLAFPAGLASGLAMSMASAGGPPLMLYLLRSGLDVTQLRATAILFFAANSACALLGLWLFDALGTEHLQLAVGLLLPALLGNFAGQYLHHRWQPGSLRVIVGALLAGLSGWLLLTSLSTALAASL